MIFEKPDFLGSEIERHVPRLALNVLVSFKISCIKPPTLESICDVVASSLRSENMQVTRVFDVFPGVFRNLKSSVIFS